MVLITLCWTLVLTLCTSANAQSSGARTALAKASAAVQNQRFDAALKMLLELENDFGGTPEFDLLLGHAAVEAGDPGLAVFALERVVSLQPKNVAARALLARALFDLKDDTQARKELENLKAEPVGDETLETIERYLAAIDDRTEQEQWQFRAFYELTAGFDSNVNGATSDEAVSVPGLGNLSLLNTTREQESPFWAHQIAGQVAYRYSPSLQLSAGADVRFRRHTKNRAEGFDHRDVNLNLGLSQRMGNDTLNFTVATRAYQVDNLPVVEQTFTRRSFSATGQWRRTLDARTQASVFAQASAINFHPSSQQTRNIHQAMLGAAYAKAFELPGSPVAFISAYVGRDWPRRDGAAFVGRGFLGVRAGGEYELQSDLHATASVAFEHSNYGGVEPLFQKDRADRFVQARAGLRYQIEERWTVRPELRLTRNFSNLPVNDYSRIEASVSVRHTFQ